MIEALIRHCLAHRGLVLAAAVLLAAGSLISVRGLTLDAIPDLSDPQVVLRASWPGQSPAVVEEQLTYALTSRLRSVPRARAVRAWSMYGDAFVYVLFEDGTDPYWARSRVLEQLAQVQGQLPQGARVELGPDATGVGWVYQYALLDRSGNHDLADLRRLQDGWLRYELQRLPGVAEVAAIGGHVRQFEAVIDPLRLQHHGLEYDGLIAAVTASHAERSGGRLELGGTDLAIRGEGLVRRLGDLADIPTDVRAGNTALTLGDIAELRESNASRNGIAELDGEGEVVGGIVVMRDGGNAREVIAATQARIEQLRPSLPEGVELVTVYDRSELIDRAIGHLGTKLVVELALVALVCLVYLRHARSALVSVISLPLGLLVALAILHWQGLSANIMSLGGIAIAIGAMVDAAIVMVENAHLHLARHATAQGAPPIGATHWRVVGEACREVGPALFFSLLITALSFLPVFMLEGQEGRMFAPLAWTKTWSMVAAAVLAVTLVPVLIGYWVRGHLRPHRDGPIEHLYAPALRYALTHPRRTLMVAALACATALWPLAKLPSEFMPPLEEGDLLFMPTTLASLPPQDAAALLQHVHQAIRSVPEVAQVFGKAGRADTATDPAPLAMIESVVRLKPREAWRPGLDRATLEAELAAAAELPGLVPAWVPPILNRITMQASGLRTPLGLRVSGDDLDHVTREAERLATLLAGIPGTRSAFADRGARARGLRIVPDRAALAQHGLSMAALQNWIGHAIGGAPVIEAFEDRLRVPVVLRLEAEWRDSPEALQALPLRTPAGTTVRLGDLAEIVVEDAPAMILSEDARLSAYVFIDLDDPDLGAWIERAESVLHAHPSSEGGLGWAWTGNFASMERASERLALAVPLTLLVVFGLLYATFGRFGEAALLMLTLPLATVGGLWLVWALGHATSVAVAVGFIALAGVAAEFGVVMLITLHSAVQAALRDTFGANAAVRRAAVDAALVEGALRRLRPKLMTVTTLFAGLTPMLFGDGVGAATLERIAAPMVGGMLSAPLLSLLVLPAGYRLLVHWRLRHAPEETSA
jgi:Cu(I)/Ag(I) efflux system membrane protein CusA/SilA